MFLRCVIGGEGRGGEGREGEGRGGKERGGEGGEEREGSVPTLCVLWSGVSLLQAFRGKGKVSFQISRLDSEAGVGPISLCYCCTNVCSILVMNGSIVVGRFTHWCDGRVVERYACRTSHAMCKISNAHFTLESVT